MSIDPEAFQRDLETVAMYDGELLGRVNRYWHSELEYVNDIRQHFFGTLLLFHSFQSLFLETVALLNQQQECKFPLPFYMRFVPKLVHTFHQLCASELIATHGYPMPAYTLLRNTFDQIILISAALQGITDFFKIEGSNPPHSFSMSESKKIRKQNEYQIRRMMTGSTSGLSKETIERIKLWDSLFDLETHGAHLSLGLEMNWIQGREAALHVHPKFNTQPAAMYINRLSEVAWMCHRLIPMLQNSSYMFPETWSSKWNVVDTSFRDQVSHFANQQREQVGSAIIELVSKKFPFSAHTTYPLEGQEQSNLDKEEEQHGNLS